MRISCSIVCFNNPPAQIAKLLECFVSSSVAIEIFVQDNSLQPVLKETVLRYGARYQHFSHNLGFGAAHNKAIAEALSEGFEFHLLANPDIEFGPDAVAILARFLEQNSDVGAVVPKVFYPDGEVQHLCKLLPSPKDLIFRRFFPRLYEQAGWLAGYELRNTGYQRVMPVPALSGCFVLLRCSILRQVGSFDERFFMYLEDVDLSRRIGSVSRTIFCPDATVIHEYGKGSYRNPRLLWYHIQSAVKYFNKWGWLWDKGRKKMNRATLDKLASLKLR